jgi:Ion channel
VTDSGPPSTNRRERFGLLLGAIIVAFAFQGIASPNEWQEVVISGLLGSTFLLALWAGEVRPLVLRLGVVIVAGVFILSVVEAVNGNPSGGALRVANAALVLLAPPAIIAGVVRILRARQTVTLEAVFGVLSIYILLGMFFAFLFGAIDRLGGAPFFAGGQKTTVAQCLYFSFTTLTTVGYGDLTARTNLGHTLSVSEALLGQIYLVTIVSLIVANLGRSRPEARSR